MMILGINAYHGDASAALVVDGQLVAAVEEERYNRIKHWAGFPIESVRYCLEAAGVGIESVDHIAISRDPSANLHRKVLFTVAKRPNIGLVRDRLANAGRVKDPSGVLAEGLGVGPDLIRATMHRVEHHRAHMASAFLVSPFEQAACLSIDGFGDFVSAMWGDGRGNTIKPLGRVLFPHSLGIFYTAITQYIGFLNYGDEYKVMGLAPYGVPEYLDAFRQIIRTTKRGFELDLDYFLHHAEGVAMTWDGGSPTIGNVYSDALVARFGPAREPSSPLEDRHRNLAASLQARCEEVYFHLVNLAHSATGHKALCLAGGVAYNSVANGKIFANTPITDIYIQPAAGDAGTAIGAAFHVWNTTLGNPRSFTMRHSYWGSSYSDDVVRDVIARRKADFDTAGCSIRSFDTDDELCANTASAVAEGLVVGWFQGRMEWGARALGNRSIVTDPRRTDMKDILNARIKRREPFRPFCPSILEDRVGEYFDQTYPEPFMIKVYNVRPEKRATIPAVTHVDGTGRLQTVNRTENPLYAQLIEAFDHLTGVPVVLNTSFNENEPIVRTPDEAIDCFLRTKMDVLAIGRSIVTKA